MAPGLTGWAPLTSELGAFKQTIFDVRDRGYTPPPVEVAHVFMLFTRGRSEWTPAAIETYNTQTALWNDMVLSNPQVAIGGAIVNVSLRSAPLTWLSMSPPGLDLPLHVTEVQIGNNHITAEPGSVTGDDLLDAFAAAKAAAGGGTSVNTVILRVAVYWGDFNYWADPDGVHSADNVFEVYDEFMAELFTIGTDEHGEHQYEVSGWQPWGIEGVPTGYPLLRDHNLGYSAGTWPVFMNYAFELHPVPVPTP